MPRRLTDSEKWLLRKTQLLKKFKSRCFYCNSKINTDNMHIEHFIPISRNGKKYDESNIVLSCKKCNLMKWRYTPKEFLEKTINEKQLLKNEIKHLNKIIKKLEVYYS